MKKIVVISMIFDDSESNESIKGRLEEFMDSFPYIDGVLDAIDIFEQPMQITLNDDRHKIHLSDEAEGQMVQSNKKD